MMISPIKKLGKMLESKNLKDICIAAEFGRNMKNLSSINSKDHDFKIILNKRN